MRRRRGGRRPEARPEKKRTSRSGAGWRLPLLAVVALLLGSGSGYLYATQLLFPGVRAENTTLVEVPDVRGLEMSEVGITLENRGFVQGRVDSILHPSVPEGRIVGQAPLAGQLSLPGGAVEVMVSLGPERRPVPDVTRLRVDRALTVLETSGFQVAVDSVEADAPEGQVVSTDPEAGTRVTLPSNIRMTVSLGPPLIELPDLVGMQEEDARAALEELGFVVGEVENRARFGFGQGDVLETFPEAGAMVPRGGAIRLVVRRRSLLPGGQ
ncbi:hypothetical protein BH23GEM11_BH23GEM11_00710 [soil metagenome]